MRHRTRRRVQLALVTVAAPAAAWVLEQAARRAEVRNQTSSLASRRLRQGADLVQHFGRGPLADRLSRRANTTVTREDREPRQADHHGG